MKRTFKKLLCAFLSAIMIIQVLPMTVWGAEIQNKTLPKIVNTNNDAVELTHELSSESNAYEKTYLANDGTKVSICKLSDSGDVSATSTYSLNSSEETDGIVTLKLHQKSTPEIGDFILGSSKKNYAILEFNLEKLTNSFVQNAYLSLECKKINNKSGNRLIVVPLKSAWDPSKNPSFNSSNKLDYIKLDESYTNSTITLDITKYLNNCITGGTNFGLVLYNYVDVLDEFSNLDLYINYKDIAEVDKNIENEIIDMGRAGTVYINDFNGSPTIVRNEIGLDGSLAPVQIQSILNPYNEVSRFTGSNFRTNYESTISLKDDTFVWDMCTGEKAYLTYKSKSVSYKTYTGTDSSGNELTLKWYPTNNKYNSENLEGIKITDSENYEYHFNSNGFLTEILTNSNDESKITIKYFENNGTTRILTITDGANRIYKFEYNDRNLVSKISINKFNGTEYIPLQIKGNNIVIKYLYDDNGLLSQVKYPNDIENVKYEYDKFNRILNITSNNGNLLSFKYTSNNNLSIINNFCVIDSNETTIQNITIDYSETYRRTFTNELETEGLTQKTKILDFNKSYQLIYLEDFDNKNYFLNYQKNELENVLNSCSSNNLIQYGMFDNENGKYSETSDYSDYWNDIGNGEITVDNNTSRRLRSSKDCLRILNTIDDITGVYQIIEGDFKAGEQYILEAYAMASSSVPINDERLFSILVSSSNTNDDGIPVRSDTISQIDFQPYIKNWQLQKQIITIPEDTKQLYIYLCYTNMENFCYFDSVKLYKYNEKKAETAIDKTSYTYDSNGRLSKETITEKNIIGTIKSQKEKTYTYEGNNLSSITDNGVTTYYNYDENSLLTSYGFSPDSEYNTKYSYNGMGALESIEQIVNQIDSGDTQGLKNMKINTSYAYEHDNITEISHNGFTYKLTYDASGNVSNVSVNNSSIFSFNNKYGRSKNQLSKITYGDGTSLIYQKSIDDDYYNIVDIYEAKQNNPDVSKLEYKYEFKYDYDGSLVEYIDQENNTTSIWYNDEHIIYGNTDLEFLKKINKLFNNSIDIDSITEVPIYRYTKKFNGTILGQLIKQSNINLFDDNYSVISTSTYSKTLNTTTNTDRFVYGETDSIKDIPSAEDLKKLLNNSNCTVAKTTTDGYGRTTKSSLTSLIDGNGVTNNYSYKDLGSKKTTNLLSEYESFFGKINSSNQETDESSSLLYKKYKYEYNSKGQITDVYLIDKNLFKDTTLDPGNIGDGLTPTKVYHYEYDELGQLIAEVNLRINAVILYRYDAGGNVVNRAYYREGDFEYDPVSNELTLGDNSLNVACEYNDSSWKDLMTSINGKEIHYDNAGNPLNYVGTNLFGNSVSGDMKWSGKQLVSFKDNANKMYYEYKYNADGLRTQKKMYSIESNGDMEITCCVDYIWENDIITGYQMTRYNHNEIQSTLSVKPIYDDNNSLMGMIYDIPGNTPEDNQTITVPVLKDGLGNITDVYTNVNNQDIMFHYDYDSYGNCYLNFSSPDFDSIDTGSSILDVLIKILVAIVYAAVINGMIVLTQQNYRGYLYDAETGLYYNQTRYYSPSWCRFINSDDVNVLTKDAGEVLGANLFKYCDNDPINYTDPSGFSKLSNGYDNSLLSLMGITPTESTKLNISKPSMQNTIENKMIESSLKLTTQQQEIWSEVFNNNNQTVYKNNGYNYLSSHIDSIGNDQSKIFDSKSKTPYGAKSIKSK